MRRVIFGTILVLAATLFLLAGCGEEEPEVEEPAVVPMEKAPTQVGQWVEYDIQDAVKLTLSLLAEEEFEGEPCYWFELFVFADAVAAMENARESILKALEEEGITDEERAELEEALANITEGIAAMEEEGVPTEQEVIVKALVAKSEYEALIVEIDDFIAEPDLPQADFIMYVVAPVAESEEVEHFHALMDRIGEIVKRLIVQPDPEMVFELDLPDVLAFAKEEIQTPEDVPVVQFGFETDARGEQEVKEGELIELPDFELVRDQTLELLGKTYACDLVVITEGEEKIDVYYTPAVPFFGLLQAIAEDEVVVTLVGYGMEGAESRLPEGEIPVMTVAELEEMFAGAEVEVEED